MVGWILFVNIIPQIFGQVTDAVSSVIVAQLLFLQSESSKSPIHMYINSPGKLTENVSSPTL